MRAAIGRVIDMALTFRIECDPARVSKLYRDLLSVLPADLLVTGIDLVLAETTDNYRVPLPGMILKAVMAEWQRRRANLDRLRTARMIGERRGWPAETAPGEYIQKKDLDELLSGVRETLDDASAAFRSHGRRPRMTAKTGVVKVQVPLGGANVTGGGDILVYNQAQSFFEMLRDMPPEIAEAMGDSKKAFFEVEYLPGGGVKWGARVDDHQGW